VRNISRIGLVASMLVAAAVMVLGGYYKYSPPSRMHIVHAQGVSVPFGYVPGVNAFPPVTATGAAGTTTNPASNFIVQVDGGPIYCAGSQGSIAESTLTLTASTTNLIVFNCPQELLYSKQAVIGPGSGTGTAGQPSSILFAAPGVEVPIATVVCNATACGNGGNGTITDNRPLSSFPAGPLQAGSVTFANLPATFPNGAALYCSNCLLASSPCTGASTGAMALRVNGAWRCQ
jgi:hypothetical protein